MPVIRAAVFDESKAYVARRAFSASGRQFTAGEIVPPDAALSPERFRQWFENRMIIAAPQEMKPNGNGHAPQGPQPAPSIGVSIVASNPEAQASLSKAVAATIAGPTEGAPQEPDAPKDPNRIEHVGRGWHDIYVGGVAVAKKRGEDEARAELTLRLGAQITSETKGADMPTPQPSTIEQQLDIEAAVLQDGGQDGNPDVMAGLGGAGVLS